MMQNIKEKIGYTFKNKKCLKNALTLAHGGKSAPYERLEFLGDRVLGLIIADSLLQVHRTEDEGDIAKRFTALVREETLATLARQIHLSEYMITHEDEMRENNSILADVMEAIIGALYVDGGLEAACAFVKPLYADLLARKVEPPVDAKTALQEWGHRHKLPLPVYKVIEKTGPDHAPHFTMNVYMQGYPPVKGQGSSKRHAEQDAAATFLKEHIND